MSDVYNLSDDARWIISRRKGVTSRAVQDLDANPDQAARAILLGNSTGVPPSVINDDIANFEQQHKAALTARILNDNKDLRDWTEEDSMAAKVANDDWGRLDDISRAARRHMLKGWPDIGFTSIVPGPLQRVEDAMGAGFGRAYRSSMQESYPSVAEEYERATPYIRPLLWGIRRTLDAAGAALHGASAATHDAVYQAAKEVGFNDIWASRLAKGSASAVEWKAMDAAAHFGVHVDTVAAVGKRFDEAFRLAEPYIEAGKPIPDGLHPLIDAMKADESRLGIQEIDALLDEAEKSPVRERAADVFTKLIRRATGDKEIAIPLEAIDRLYAGKLPAVDDGILGFDKDIVGKIARARPTMGDVRLNLAEYIGHVEPEIREQLKKDYKPEVDGQTLNQIEEKEKEPKPPLEPPAPDEQAMADAGLTPSEMQKPDARRLAEISEGYGWIAGEWRKITPEDLAKAKETLRVATEAKAKDLEKFEAAVEAVKDDPYKYPTFNMLPSDWQVNLRGFPSTKEGYIAGARQALENKYRHEGWNAARLERILKRVEPKTLRQQISDSAALNQLTPVLLEEGQPEQPLFGKMAIGLPKKLYDRWVKLSDKQGAEEAAWQLRKAFEEVKRRRSKEWIEESNTMRPEVTNEVVNRGEWLIHNWFKDGLLRGAKPDMPTEKPKIDPDYLTREERASIPREYLKKGGLNPDDLAPYVGLSTGKELIDVMARFYKEKGDLFPGEYLERIVRDEVNKRMEAKYGKKADAILAEAQDAVTGITPMERLHEQTVALGLKSGAQITFTKESMAKAARQAVRNEIMKGISRDKYLKDAGIAGRRMIQAFLKQDWVEAFRWSQVQYMAGLMNKEAGRILKSLDQFNRKMKQFNAREPKGYDNPLAAPYMPYVHQIMERISELKESTRSIADIQDAITQGKTGTLDKFIANKQAMLKSIEVPDFLLDPNWRKPVQQMTGGEFEQVHRSLTSLITNARDEGTIYREGMAYEVKDIVEDKMTAKVEKLGKAKIDISKRQPIRSALRSYRAQSLTAETMLNRIDQDDPSGVHNQFVVRPLAESANREARLLRFYQQALLRVARDLTTRELDRKVDNTLFRDPITGDAYDLRHRNVLGILAYWGSPSSRAKLLEGYGLDEATTLRWLEERTTKADWDRMQKIGHLFTRLVKLADNMSMEIHGVPVEKIDIVPFTVRHGTYKGWYNPIKYSRLALDEEGALGPKFLEDENYYRANTSQAYTKARTEYVDLTELNMDIIPQRMKQMIHDISFRPAVLQAAKVFYNPKWRAYMKRYYGEEIEAQFIPFLKDVANYTNHANDPASFALEYLRQNLISTMIGFNLNTVMKHGMTAGFNSMREVGTKRWLKEFAGLMMSSEETGKNNWQYAMDRSEELQRRWTRWEEMISGRQRDLTLMKTGPRAVMTRWGSKPVSFSDMLSSVPTWLAKYKEALERGVDEGQAIFEADRAVRRAHGSSAITNLPNIMRTNALGRTYTSLYGFFSHMLQKQYEIAWKARDSIREARGGDLTAMKKFAPDIVWGIVSYVIIPAVVEELVTPYVGSDKDSWGTKAAKMIAIDMAASLIGPRDFVHGLMNHAEPTAGMVGTMFKEFHKLGRDMSKGTGMFSRRDAGNTLLHTMIVTGILTGYTNAEMGRVLKFYQRWMNNLEHPKGPFDWIRAYRSGTIHPERRQ